MRCHAQLLAAGRRHGGCRLLQRQRGSTGFAAAELAQPAFRKAVSMVLAGGLIGAVIGEHRHRTRRLAQVP